MSSFYWAGRRFPAASTLNSEIGYVFDIALSGSGLFVATQDRSIRRMDLETFSLGAQISPAHDATITSIAAVRVCVPGAGSGEVVLSTSNDGTCKFWDLRDAKNSSPIVTVKLSGDCADAPVYAGAVSDSGVCAVGIDSRIALFQFGHWAKNFEYTESHMDAVNVLRFADATTLVSGGEDGMVNVFNVADLVNEDDGQCPIMTLNTDNSVREIFLDQTQSVVVFSGTESVSCWDLSSGCRKMPDNESIRCHPTLASEGWGYLVSCSSEGKILAGNAAGVLSEFDMATSEMCTQFSASHNGVVRAAVYLPDGRLITAGEDGLVFEWTKTAQPEAHSHVRTSRTHNSANPY